MDLFSRPMSLTFGRARAQPLDLDTVNRGAWREPGTVRAYRRLSGWTDPGERAAVAAVAARSKGQPILDIGVGAGRTTGLLRAISDDYVGIDYTQEMVEACRRRHPGVRILQMDARDLSAFAAGRFRLAVFSFNGIDAVDPAGRRQILREAYRVLQPGGLLLLSAHNRNGPTHGEKPRPHLDWTWNPLKLGWRTMRLALSLQRGLRNHHRYRHFNETHTEWSIMNCAAHDFGIVIVYTSFTEQRRQLREVGFEIEIVFENVAGGPVDEATDTSAAAWFHYIARKP
jgi:SAM-dependent methyltransferase